MTDANPVTPVAFRDALKQFPETYAYHEQMELKYSVQSRYLIAQKLGWGKYSDVFKGYQKINENEIDENPIVIKVLKPVKQLKVNRELKILTNLIGGPFIMRLQDVVAVQNSNYPAFILEFGGESLQQQQSLTLRQYKLFAGQLLLALHYCHCHGVIHRDVKGGNICVDLQRSRLTLLDFGLAEFYQYGKALHHRVATRHFKPPELLCSYQYYDYSLDIWSAGAMMAGFLFQRQPFFRGTSNVNQLDKVVEILGSKDFTEMVRKYKIDLGGSRMRELSGYQQQPLKSFINSDNSHLVSNEAVDMLNQMLRTDPERRPTAQQLLQHAWFDEVRKELAESYLQEFRVIKMILAEQFANVPVVCLPSYGHNDSTKYPVPVSPNEIAQENVVDDEEWARVWVEFQMGAAKRGQQ